MKKSELKEMIKTAFLSEADFTNAQDDDASASIAADYDPLAEEKDMDEMVADLYEADEEEVVDEKQMMYKLQDAVADGEGLEDASADELEKYAQIALEFEDHIDVVNAFEYLENLPNYRPEFTPDNLRRVEEETMDEVKEESLDDILDSIIGTIDEAKGDDEMEDESRAERADVDKYEFEKGKEAGEKEKEGDSIVIDKKIVSLSSLPGDTRKILDTLETLRAEAEEFGDQKFITQVGNTITFFTRDFVVAGDAPNPAGIEEGDGELDVNIDSEKSTAEMEAGLGLEESTFPMWNKIK